MAARTYGTPLAFKNALEERLRKAARQGTKDMNRLRQVLIYERFMARIGQVFGDRATLKGGVVLELRLDRARATRDVDLRVTGKPDALEGELRAAGSLSMPDHLSFTVEPDRDHPTIESPGMVYEGRRFRAAAQLAGRLYGMPFGVDVAFADALSEQPELLRPTSFLEFAGVEPVAIRAYPRVVHIAEKLHAYTMPRPTPNSRVKDLPDIALLSTTGTYSAAALLSAIEHTFSFRKTHPVPQLLPPAPQTWAALYARIAEQNGLQWSTLDEVHSAASAFLEAPLSGRLGTWAPIGAKWEPTVSSVRALPGA